MCTFVCLPGAVIGVRAESREWMSDLVITATCSNIVVSCTIPHYVGPGNGVGECSDDEGYVHTPGQGVCTVRTYGYLHGYCYATTPSVHAFASTVTSHYGDSCLDTCRLILEVGGQQVFPFDQTGTTVAQPTGTCLSGICYVAVRGTGTTMGWKGQVVARCEPGGSAVAHHSVSAAQCSRRAIAAGELQIAESLPEIMAIPVARGTCVDVELLQEGYAYDPIGGDFVQGDPARDWVQVCHFRDLLEILPP